MRLNMGFDQRRELRIRGGLEHKKHTTVKVMYSMMLNRTTNTMLCAERVWRAPVAKQEENVALIYRNAGLEIAKRDGQGFRIESLLYSPNQQ